MAFFPNTAAALQAAQQAAASGTPYSTAVQQSGLLAGFRSDCSGFVDWIASKSGWSIGQAATPSIPSEPSLQAGQGGTGGITVWNNPNPGQLGHVIIDIAGRWFESGGMTGGGPHQMTTQQAAQELGVSDISQLGAGATPRGFSPFTPRGGQRQSMIVTASVFGGPGDPGTGSTGYHGDNLYQHPDSFAELSKDPAAQDFSALGNLPYNTPIQVTNLLTGKSMTVYKRDVGAGGPGLQGHPRAVDLWFQAAQQLGISGLGLVRVSFVDTSGGTPATGISRPGGQAAGTPSGGDQITPLFQQYEDLVDMPRTAPSGFVSLGGGPAAPFRWWWQSFSGKWPNANG